MFWKLPSNRILLFGFLFIIGFVAAFYLLLGRNADKTITQQLLQRQQTLARAEASNISSFFKVFGDSIAVLSRISTTEAGSMATSKDLDVFIEQWRYSNQIRGIILTNEAGIVKFNSNVLGTHDIGVSIADRDYFLWAIGNPSGKSYFVGKPVISRLGASKGETIVPVASAVYRNGVFRGVLVASVKLNSLTQHYLGLMNLSDTTETYLINEKGELLYSTVTRDPILNDQEFSSRLKDILNEKKDGKLESKEHLLAYSNIMFDNQNWLLIIAAPAKEVTNLTAPIFVRLIVMVLLVSVTMLFYGFISTGITRKDYDNNRI